MSVPSEQVDRPVVVKKEVFQVDEQFSGAGLIPSSAPAEVEIDGLCCLSGDKPFFVVILSKSHICSPYNLKVASHMVPKLPRVVVPMVLTHGDKKWKMSYDGRARQHRFEFSEWKSFVSDNNLKCGDACIFELMESSTMILRFRVVILRNTSYFPPELKADIPAQPADTDCAGRTLETAIEIN